ncbi:integral membrane protein (TIGR01906 family) [Arthrobacter sp. SLBN-83]|uniref:TIGR01906 family membrane protein n=1 Tax=Arthrobacter sp. SLBN-83 TaxID=2768449 RepID=UPI001151D89E|nr:TIGR01906 family membrane protein [Arthrobacter sp. SLBN-83]TQJ57863.1 integral membrane protein (TIGR01906 family) [Arthrobacter sp. SLBN-83]
MNDETPARAKSAAPQPEPFLDTSGDSDEPAFSWLTPTDGDTSHRDNPNADQSDANKSAADKPSGDKTSGGITDGGASDRNIAGEGPGRGAVGGETDREARRDTRNAAQPETRADRKAAEAAVGSSALGTPASARPDAERPAAGASTAGPPTAGASIPGSSADEGNDSDSPVFKEPLPTSALHVRPPEEEVERRNAQRESAANAKPVAPRVMQVLLAIIYPFILLILAVRAVTSPLFLWVEYNRPGFPGDGYGFNTDDRMTYGSYAVDYLSNWAGPRYLGDLVNRGGEKLFKDGEVSHMADVKVVILSTFGAGVALLLLALIAILYLRKRSTGGTRRGLFAGSIITLVLILGLGTLAALGWQQFFTEFHRIFFADGSWTFSLDDTLIRLFPSQFWMDAGIAIAAMVLLASIVTLVLTWPTRRRRGVVRAEEPAKAGREKAGQETPEQEKAAQP